MRVEGTQILKVRVEGIGVDQLIGTAKLVVVSATAKTDRALRKVQQVPDRLPGF